MQYLPSIEEGAYAPSASVGRWYGIFAGARDREVFITSSGFTIHRPRLSTEQCLG